MGFIKRNPQLSTVEEIVTTNTGMTSNELLSDGKEYKVVNLDEAADLVLSFKDNQHGIVIFGDYDVDGITSTCILQEVLSRICRYKWRVFSRYPKRFSEGYGAKPEAVEGMTKSDGLLILVDNGIKAFAAVEKAKEMGMKVLILDHHEPELGFDGNMVLPNADVVVDPKVFSENFNYYCGAGLALKLVEEIMKRTGYSNDWGIYKMTKAYATLGTVCDQVPLIGDNRRIVKEGLAIINEAIATKNAAGYLTRGMYALVTELGLEEVTEKSIGFKIGPCINAWGRLDDDGAAFVANALRFNSYKNQACAKALEVIAKNEERKELSENWFNLSVERIKNEGMERDYPIVIHMENMPEGIAGLIAGKLAERYETPTFVFTDTQVKGVIKGSSRTDGRIDINDLLSGHTDLILAYGGHKGAAGLSINKKDLKKFRKVLQADLGEKPKIIQGDTAYDLEIIASDIPKVIEDVKKYAPYGEGNPAPEFYVKNLMAIPDGSVYFKELSHNGIKIATEFVSCVTFDASDKYKALDAPKKFNAVGVLTTNVFRGNVTNQLEMTDVEAIEVATPKKSALQLAIEEKARERAVV